MAKNNFLVGECNLNQIEGFYDDEFGPTIHLKEGIDLRKLQDDGGVEFEVDETMNEAPPLFKQEEVYKHCDTDALGLSDKTEGDEDGDDDEGSPFEVLAKSMVALTPDGGVKKQLLKQGTGGEVPDGAKVTIQYNVYCEYSDEPCDSTYLRNRPYGFNLSMGDKSCYDVIVGLDIAVRSMKKNEVAKFLIRHEYGYGKLGVQPRIPAEATLLFQVELLNFSDCGGHENFWNLSFHERKEAPFNVVLKAAVREKEIGKEQFLQKRYHPAIRRYTQAMRILENCRLADEHDEQKQQKLLLKIYLNIAVCCIKLCMSARVISYCNQAQQIDRNNCKVFYLRGKALRQLGEFDRSRENLIKAKKLEPANKDIAKEIEQLEQKVRSVKLMEKQFYKKMFGNTEKKTTSPTEVNSTSTQKIEEDFKKDVRESLQSFIEDSGMMEIPFSKSNFSEAELVCITKMAEELDLNVSERGEGLNFHIKVQKRRAPAVPT